MKEGNKRVGGRKEGRLGGEKTNLLIGEVVFEYLECLRKNSSSELNKNLQKMP